MMFEGENEAIKSIPHSERIARMSAIQVTIPRESIRVQMIQGRSAEMWGLVSMEGLPFYFRAWPSVVTEKLEFLENGFKVETRWKFIHRPYPVDDFRPTILTQGITEKDEEYILKTLGQQGRDVVEEYRQFNERYDSDFILRKAFGAAVSIVCDEKEASL